MTNKEILNANLLDIIFENRNKEYGAYALRNDYDRRLLKALGIGLGTVLIFILLNFIKFANTASGSQRNENDGYNLVDVNLKPEDQPEPEKPKDIKKPKPGQVAHVPPQIVPDVKANSKTPTQDDLNTGDVSTINTDGKPDGIPDKVNLTPAGNEATDNPKPQEPPVENKIKIAFRNPEYPGGFAALSEFMRNNLITPDDLEIGDKKIVKVKFTVGKDGSITDIAIVESPGKTYDKEVTRVVKKMPRWQPAIQNDMEVSLSYILPVTFIAVEE